MLKLTTLDAGDLLSAGFTTLKCLTLLIPMDLDNTKTCSFDDALSDLALRNPGLTSWHLQMDRLTALSKFWRTLVQLHGGLEAEGERRGEDGVIGATESATGSGLVELMVSRLSIELEAQPLVCESLRPR